MKLLYGMAAIFSFAFPAYGQEAAGAVSSGPALSANDVIEQIKSHVGVPWQEPTVDTFKAGDPQTRVTGIAVTMMATLDVLQRAAANGQNLVIDRKSVV